MFETPGSTDGATLCPPVPPEPMPQRAEQRSALRSDAQADSSSRLAVAPRKESPAGRSDVLRLAAIIGWGKAKLGSWLGKRAAQLRAWPLRAPRKPAIPQVPKPSVQAELSLASVKVVRNDLSDSDLDLELVPAQRAASKAGSTAGKTKPGRQPADKPGVQQQPPEVVAERAGVFKL
jgi:hypothetical protein